MPSPGSFEGNELWEDGYPIKNLRVLFMLFVTNVFEQFTVSSLFPCTLGNDKPSGRKPYRHNLGQSCNLKTQISCH